MKVSSIALTGVVSVFTVNQLMVLLHAFSLQSQGYILPSGTIKKSQMKMNQFHRTYMSVSPMEETESSSSSSNNRMKMSREHMQRTNQENKMSSSNKDNTSAINNSISEAEIHRTGRSRHEIENELASGRILEDGPVIDFGSIKDTSSKAERALAQAREDYLAAVHSKGKHAVKLGFAGDGNSRLMGINDEVVVEVGREVGAFVKDETMVQSCAAYLRSRATKGMFQEIPDAPMVSQEEMKSMDVSALERLLQEAYEESGIVTEAFAKTFYLGTQLLPTPAQRAIWAIYVWCRRTDEIVDAPRKPEDVDMLTDLSAWEIRLENLFRYGMVEDVLDLPLLDCKIKYPNLPIEPFVDMVRGMLMDIPDLGQDRYETFEELHLYCYRVAGTVGLMSMPVFGCATGYTEEEAKEPALSLGVAFQLTNILRDVGEDAVKRGRVYLPREDMENFGVTEEQIFAQRLDDNYIAMMKFQIERARMYYDRALRGVPMLSPESRLPVQSSLDCYGKILDKIEENGYDSLTKRAYVSKWEKLATIPFSWYRTLDISK
eukprot:CAMPEP_0176493874 /NCGR_PEP_ID=MMETSP0200_2-20121128/9778_1 /TAXON_ID=947934 /ORGANISM="Chaetoceros sp., Strain GSL56" /LENGTH=545 /DNA_ID=CAMNT_0017891559 /DNA_START=671 /DNA_END=2305 /DNA_ORIENTATION=+